MRLSLCMSGLEGRGGGLDPGGPFMPGGSDPARVAPSTRMSLRIGRGILAPSTNTSVVDVDWEMTNQRLRMLSVNLQRRRRRRLAEGSSAP